MRETMKVGDFYFTLESISSPLSPPQKGLLRMFQPKPKTPKRRERERQRLPMSFQRISGFLEVFPASPSEEASRKTPVHLILNDLSSGGAGLFSAISLPTQQKVTLHLEQPLLIALPAKIAWCQEHGTTHHVLSKTHYPYRMGLQFTLEKEEEKSQISSLLKLIKKPS